MNKLLVILVLVLVLISFVYSSRAIHLSNLVRPDGSKVVSVTSTEWVGSKDVVLPSNFDSLNTKAKLDVLNGGVITVDLGLKNFLRNLIRSGN
jgi:hypothetical protein